MNFAIWQTACATATAVGLAGTSAYFSPWVWRQHRMDLIRRQAAQCRTLALTYDDGPSSEVTPQLLDLLGSRNARATFFMVGRRAQQYPQIANRIIREGHDVGCHSYNHVNAWKATPWNALADIREGYDRLSAWIPSDGMFRPPNGKMTLPTYWAIRRRGAPVWWWTIDSRDSKEVLPSLSEVADRVSQERGGIVLMHDGSIGARSQQWNKYVLAITATLLDIAERESLRVVPLTEFCGGRDR